jgi:hypothetical protein
VTNASRPAKKKWKTVNVWPIKGPVLLLALLLGIFDHSLHWTRAVAAVGLAMIVPIIGFRDFWKTGKFWITVALLTAAQVPVARAVKPLMERLRFPFMLTFAMLDCTIVTLCIWWVCSEDGRAEP